jgi:hypothetical protein
MSTQRADPLADQTIAAILGACGPAPDWAMIGVVNRQFEQWTSNGALSAWHAGPEVPAQVAQPLEAYVRAGQGLPQWSDMKKIARAEVLFFDYGILSCTLLFCSSLPECYVIPDLAAVLHVAGQLEQHTEHRIRATAAMIFPVMMRGGMTMPEGTGRAQILKVRLIHATIRYLILRGSPDQADLRGMVAPLYVAEAAYGPASMHQAMFARGWNTADDGLPCNQEELAYTLLTFGYVFLRSLRKLGLGLSAADEEAYLHAWNVLGHVLGIERALMPDSMAQAETMFAALQARGRREPWLPDPRPALGGDLMKTMQVYIPFRLLRPFPVLLTRYLCGGATARDIGIDKRVNLVSRLLFVGAMVVTRGIDALVRLALPEFSLCRMFTRVVGYHFTVKLLMDQTRPLNLPPQLLGSVNDMMQTLQRDPKAPKWVNAIERSLTRRKEAPAAGAPP